MECRYPRKGEASGERERDEKSVREWGNYEREGA
jgi:hypothetical protein